VLSAETRPKGWSYGVAVALDVDGTGAGALLLGEAEGGREWRLEASDEPMLVALAASLSSAMRGARDRESLVQETSKLKAVVEHATDGIVVVGDDGRIQLWSPAMEVISGDSAADAAADGDQLPASARLLVAAAGLPGLLYDPHMPGEAPPFPGLALPTREGLLLGLTRPDGEIREVQVSIVRIQDEVDRRQVAILTVHDVTRERRADRLKSDFVATISHELRTPITPIKGYAEVLLHRGNELTPEKRQHALALIVERADHLARLVDDLLLASRVSGEAASGLDTRIDDADLVALVRNVVAAFPALEGRVELHVPDGAIDVRCDPVRTNQCLSNLLSNAGKYAPDGTAIVVRLEAPEPGQSTAVVSVQDHGPGVPTAEQDRIFERFYRLGDPNTMTTGGSGLGLYIARELARAQGGDLTLASPPGSGSTFTLQVPLAAACAAAVPDPRTSPYPTARESS
jgi:signal transduction histidine kinase